MNSKNVQEDTVSTADSEIWIDPDSTAGAAIINLLRQLKRIEHGDGSWPGGDVVDELNLWLLSIGLHPEDDPEQAVQRLRRQPHPWTVFGLRDNDAGEILIAAVAAGEVQCRDSESGEEGGYQRVAEHVVAADAGEAERRVCELFEAACDD